MFRSFLRCCVYEKWLISYLRVYLCFLFVLKRNEQSKKYLLSRQKFPATEYTVPVHRNYVCLKQKIKFLFDKRENKCGSKQQNIINDLKDVLCTKTVCNHEMWWIRLQEIWILEMWPHNNNVPQAWQISALKLTGVILPK